MDADVVASLYTEGVDAVARQAAVFTARDWSAPACGSWSAADTMRHLVSVAGWYHDWLDRAIDGETSRPFPGEQIDAYTSAALHERQHVTPGDAVAEFRTSASGYLVRARERWDLPYGFPFGTVTVGLHLGVAATEWHLHAWDLSNVTGRRHRPQDPGGLMFAASECVAATSGRFKGALVRRVTPVAARRSPWETLLRRSGRL